jgi:hypothetical protein
MISLHELTHENTKDYIGSTFQIRFSDGSIDLTLERVDLIREKHVHPKMKRDAFALTFRGPRNPVLRQHIYPLFHEKFEEPLQLFLVPMAIEEQGAVYEAVFN